MPRQSDGRSDGSHNQALNFLMDSFSESQLILLTNPSENSAPGYYTINSGSTERDSFLQKLLRFYCAHSRGQCSGGNVICFLRSWEEEGLAQRCLHI